MALARAYLVQGDPTRAREQSLRARAMSEAMGYHWGVVDAEEVLARIPSRDFQIALRLDFAKER